METSAASRKLTSRFVAGSTLGEGIDVLRKLAADKTLGTLDCLGENVASFEDACASRDAYLSALAEIEAAKLAATVSIKLTQCGLDLSSQGLRKPT